MIKSLWNFWLNRDSESAACVAIDLAHHMSNKHLREMADYFKGVAADREHARHSGESAPSSR